MKKRIITVLAAALCTQSAVFAETTAHCVNTNGKISVTGKTTADTTVTLTVTDSENSDDFYAFKETVSDENGNFSFDFTLRDRAQQEDVSAYIIKIKGDSVYTKNISVFSDTVKDSVIAEVTDGNKSSLHTLLEDEDKCIVLENQGFNIAGYNALSDKEKETVDGNYYEDKESYPDKDAAVLFNAEVAVVLSKTADADYNDILKVVDLVGIEFSVSSDFVKNGLKNDKSYTSLSEFESKFDEFTAVERINNARFSDMEDLFDENKEVLGLDGEDSYETYLEWSDSNKRSLNQKIVTALKDGGAEDADDFLKIFKKVFKEVKASVSKGGGSGSSGGGGSKGSGSSYPGGAGSTQNTTSVLISEVADDIHFTDVDDNFWARTAIESLAKDKIINGYEDGTFRPNNSITREEFVSLIAKAFKIEGSGSCSFEDVTKDKWYYDYVSVCCEKGIINGLSETEFGTGKNITRQDAAVIVSRILNLSKGNSGEFADDDKISDYAKSAVYSLRDNGIISGDTDNNFNPKANLTRAECAVIVQRAVK